MKTVVTLETKDVREIIAKFLGVKVEDVVPNRYSFGVANMTAEEIEKKINHDKGTSIGYGIGECKDYEEA